MGYQGGPQEGYRYCLGQRYHYLHRRRLEPQVGPRPRIAADKQGRSRRHRRVPSYYGRRERQDQDRWRDAQHQGVDQVRYSPGLAPTMY
jgi:hypothetical protein